jgi:hypothetical protein
MKIPSWERSFCHPLMKRKLNPYVARIPVHLAIGVKVKTLSHSIGLVWFVLALNAFQKEGDNFADYQF